MLGRQSFVWLAIGMVAVFTFDALMIVIVSSFVSEPYMDEIFHVRQMQAYCAGKFEVWDPKITTPPGLYFASIALIRPLFGMLGPSSQDLVCSAPILRLLNALHLSILYLFIYAILESQAQKNNAKPHLKDNLLLATGTVVMFPLVFFFSLLFYTDLLSVISVLAMYALYQRRFHIFSGLFGAAACLMRQTNVVWVLFTAALSATDICADFIRLHIRKHYKGEKREIPLTQMFLGIFDIMRVDPLLGVQMVSTIFARSSVYLLVILSFGIFTVVNQGVAMGDKTAHEVVFHFPQVYYCLGFVVAFGAPIFASSNTIKSLLKTIRKHPKFLLAAAVSSIAVVYGFTYDHPYLLADNRHYTFYIWKNWFRKHWLAKYLLIPGYIAAALLISDSLRNQSQIWRLGYFISVALVTVPNRLMEFRYFILPYLMWRLHVNQNRALSRNVIVAEVVLFGFVNLLTLYMFLFQPFQWPHEIGIQRFMW